MKFIKMQDSFINLETVCLIDIEISNSIEFYFTRPKGSKYFHFNSEKEWKKAIACVLDSLDMEV